MHAHTLGHSETYIHTPEPTTDNTTEQFDDMTEQTNSERPRTHRMQRILTNSRATERKHPDHEATASNAPKRQNRS